MDTGVTHEVVTGDDVAVKLPRNSYNRHLALLTEHGAGGRAAGRRAGPEVQN